MEDEQTETPACSCTEKCVAGSVNTDCPVCSVNMSECAGKEAEPEPEETEQPPEEEKGGGMGILLVVLLLAAVSGGAFYYFKIMKPKKDAAKGSSNLDDLDFDEDDEEELETEQEVHQPSKKCTNVARLGVCQNSQAVRPEGAEAHRRVCQNSQYK
jgi:uncharacterized protein HemX